MSPAFVARCPQGHAHPLQDGAYRDCPDCDRQADPVMCDVCANPFTPSQWELRHRPHLANCAGCGDHYGVCVCPPADVHARCCVGCENHAMELPW